MPLGVFVWIQSGSNSITSNVVDCFSSTYGDMTLPFPSQLNVYPLVILLTISGIIDAP